MRVSVFGIGYVGAVAAVCLARDGHSVIAVDFNPAKVDALASGNSPIVEPGIDQLLRAAIDEGRLKATTSAPNAIANSELSFLCVGTPARPNGSLDTTHILRVAEQVGSALRNKTEFHSVVMRSTILPGTMDEAVIPALTQASGKRAGEGFGVGYYPEFLREGSAIADYDNPGAIVFGARDDRTLEALREINAQIGVQPRIMSIRAAEAVKYANNAWHALKVSFANELGLICKRLQVDSHDVMETVCSDTKLNLSPAYLMPGFAFGGSCLPKDVRALRYRAKELDVNTPVLDATLQANENQIQSAYEAVAASGRRRVGLVGLSFKPETDDLRYSPLVELAERLIGRGFQVRIYDPIIRLSRLTGANYEFITQHLPHIADLLLESVGDLLEHSEVLVTGNRREAAAILPRLSNSNVKIIDLVRVDRQLRTGGNYNGICW